MNSLAADFVRTCDRLKDEEETLGEVLAGVHGLAHNDDVLVGLV